MAINEKTPRMTAQSNSDKQSGQCVHQDRHDVDGYAQAIPMDDLIELARQCASDCVDCTTRLQIECEVRARLCPCILCDECITNAVVQEVARQRGSFSESRRTACSVSVRFQAELSSTD